MADVAKHTVKHGGKYYRPGAKVPGLKPAERKALLKAGAIEVAAGRPEPTTPADPDPDAIPESFPGAEALAKAGITTFTALDEVEDLTSIDGIGEATAKKIEAALDALEAE